jgi:hypothetical protein
MATTRGSTRLRSRPGARKKSASVGRTAAKQPAAAGSTNGNRKPIRAWNEVEIDEQRETAGRPEPAFIPEPELAKDDLAEELGEEFVLTATSGEQAAEDIRNEDVPEELGGPFIETSARTEFGYGTDASNPEDAEPAAFPTSSLEPSVNPLDADSENNSMDADSEDGEAIS